MKKFILSVCMYVCIVMVFFSCKNDTTKPTFKVKDIVGNWQSNDDKDSKFTITNSGNLEIEGISIPIDGWDPSKEVKEYSFVVTIDLSSIKYHMTFLFNSSRSCTVYDGAEKENFYKL